MEEQILSILKSHPQGLTVEQTVKQMQLLNPKVSPRGIRELINQMFDAQEICRRKNYKDTPGKPAYIYIHPDFCQHQNIFDELGIQVVITTKSQMMYEMLPEDVKQAHIRGVELLKRLSLKN